MKTRHKLTTRAALSAATLATVAGAMALTAPLANADPKSDCAKSGGTYAWSIQGSGTAYVVDGVGQRFESCTSADKDGHKRTCTWVNGSPQGCNQVPNTQADQRHAQINITPEQLGNLPDAK